MSNTRGRLMLKTVFLMLMLLSLNSYAQTATKAVVIASPLQIENKKTLSLTGSFTAIKDSALSPRVDGLITELLVDIGDSVKQGDRLMQLDSALIRLSITEQKALLEQTTVQQKEAQRLVSEAERLLKQRHISQTELAKRKANLAQTEAEVSAAKAVLAAMGESLNRHTLYAPFDGTISEKHTEVGEWISRGNAAINLTSLDKLYLDINVPKGVINVNTSKKPKIWSLV